jgi:hypothetical protein
MPDAARPEVPSSQAPRHVVVVTRYSVVDSRMQSTRTARDAESPAAYRATLLDTARLQARFEMFRSITVPSLMAQRPFAGELHFLLLISDALPEAHRAGLVELLERMAEARGIRTRILDVAAEPETPCEGAVQRSIGTAIETYLHEVVQGEPACCVATVRLDDDDALAAVYCQRLASYLRPELAGFVVSFPYGLQGVVESESARVSRLRRMYYPKVALGLAQINYFEARGGWRARPTHVYGLGSHLRVDRRCPVILDAAGPAYFRAVGEYNDSGDVPFHAFLPEVVPGEVSLKEFPFLDGRLQVPGEQAAESADAVDIDVFAASVEKARSRREIEALRTRLQSARGMIGSLSERLRRQEADATPSQPSPPSPNQRRPAWPWRLIRALTGKGASGDR